MERTPIPNAATGLITQRFRMQSGVERQEYEKSILRAPPPGMRNFVRWVDEDHFEIGAEVVPLAEAVNRGPRSVPEPETAGAAPDGLDAKSDKELQAIMGLKGIKYDKRNFVRGEAIVRIRAMTGAGVVAGVVAGGAG